MLHKVYDIELPYEKLGLKTPDKKATITTYIKEMYPVIRIHLTDLWS